MTLFGNRRAEELLRAPDATDSDEPGHPDPRERNRELARFVEPQQNRLLRELWVVASLLVVLIGVSAGEIVVALVGAAVFVAGWLARLWGRASLQRLQITQSLSNSHAFVGETVDYEFRIDNRKLLPLPWLELRTEMPEVLQPSNRELLLSGRPKLRWLERTTRARWYERITWTYPIPLTTRGFYKLGATRLRSGDLFGFFPRERQDRDELTLWVYPEVVPLQRLGIPIFRPHGESRGGNPLFEDPSRLQGLRDYRPGDPLKRIDWKATARRARLETRVYDPSSTPHIMLALNVATLPEAWQGYFGDVFERAVSVAASLAAAYADDRFPFGLIANCTYPGRDATIRVAAGRAQGQTTRVLEALAMADVFTLVPIERLIDEEARRMPLGSTLVLVTALILPGVEDALDRLRRRGYGVAVVYVGPDDPPPTAGGAPLFDIRAQLDALQFRRVDSGYTWTRADTEFAPPDRPSAGLSDGKAELPFAPATTDGDGAVAPLSRPNGDAPSSPWARPPREPPR